MLKLKENKGITLVALVVTIVVLLILAGVSINMVLGENGLIAKAKEAKNAYEQDAKNTEKGFAELYDELQVNLGEFPSTEYTKPYLPTGFTRVEGTGLSNGLVIQDSTGNQYVWVEVPKAEEVYPTAGLAITNFTNEEYIKIENDLHTYTSTYRKSGYSDTYYLDTENEGWFTEEEYYNTKKKMLKSVYQNGGFYVGRYETGIEGSFRNYGTDNNILHETTGYTPVIKANAYPYTWVTRTQAQLLANSMESGNYTSCLMFGVQWDLILKYLETKNATTQTELNTNSTTIGNYKNNLWNINNASVKYSTNDGESWTVGAYKKTTGENVLLTTGANTDFKIMNIYDIAGNVWEWTLEYSSNTDGPCVKRGGDCYNPGWSKQISCRDHIYNSTKINAQCFGFRVSIF